MSGNTFELETTNFEEPLPLLKKSRGAFIGLLNDFVKSYHNPFPEIYEKYYSGINYIVLLEDSEKTWRTYDQTLITAPPSHNRPPKHFLKLEGEKFSKPTPNSLYFSIYMPAQLRFRREPQETPYPWLIMGKIFKYSDDGSCTEVSDYLELLRMKILPFDDEILVTMSTKYRFMVTEYIPGLKKEIKRWCPKADWGQAEQAGAIEPHQDCVKGRPGRHHFEDDKWAHDEVFIRGRKKEEVKSEWFKRIMGDKYRSNIVDPDRQFNLIMESSWGK